MVFYKATSTVLRQYNYSKFKRFFSSKVRVRFAPSPTGFLHLGGLRTALYNDLFAKAHNGVNILRIEDTDLSRRVPEAVENLIEDLSWCGIKYDEGPYFQSERKEIYQKYANQLVEQGDAYHCFCSSVRLKLIRREAEKLGEIPKYDNHCRNLTKEEVENLKQSNTPSCIRFKLYNCSDSFNDLLCGPIIHDVAAFEADPIILKSDGFPTYHLANVVDDHLMGITHVLRGKEWLMSTPKHLLLYRAFKWDPPEYAHIPLLLNDDGTKFSKRQNDTQVREFRRKKILPNALINFIIRCGGGFNIKTDKNIVLYSYNELIEKFDLSKVKTSSCKVNFELLPLFNHAEIARLIETETELPQLIKQIKELVKTHFQNSKNDSLLLSEERIELILKNLKNRINNFDDLVSNDFSYLWLWENNWDGSKKIYNGVLENFYKKIKPLDFQNVDWKIFLKSFCKEHKEFKYVDIMQMIRVALTGKPTGHGVAEILTILSKEDILFRLSKILEPTLSSAASQN